MEINPAQRNLILCKGIETRLLGPPIERRAPIFDKLLQISDIRAVSPGCSRSLVGIAGAPEPFAQIGDGLVRNGEGECLRLCGHGDLVFGCWVVKSYRKERPDQNGSLAPTPSCRLTASMSPMTQRRVTRLCAIVKNAAPTQVITRPVAGTSKRTPRWIPVNVIRAAAREPAVTRSSMTQR